jgi:hypothetical protein
MPAARQQLRNKQIYGSYYWVTASQTCFHGNDSTSGMSSGVFYAVHAKSLNTGQV